jgi:hypothetical protein
MASSPQSRSRLPSAATIILIVAGLIALVSAAIAISRTWGGDSGDSPAAKDWRVVGWAYAESGNAAEAASAYRKAAAIEPDNAENWSSLGEALQSASRSVVPEAAAAFRKALELDPRDPRARYFLAVQKDLGGDPKGAVEDWLALLKDTSARSAVGSRPEAHDRAVGRQEPDRPCRPDTCSRSDRNVDGRHSGPDSRAARRGLVDPARRAGSDGPADGGAAGGAAQGGAEGRGGLDPADALADGARPGRSGGGGAALGPVGLKGRRHGGSAVEKCGRRAWRARRRLNVRIERF